MAIGGTGKAEAGMVPRIPLVLLVWMVIVISGCDQRMPTDRGD